MQSIYVLVLLVAIGFTVYYATKKKQPHLYFSIAAIILAFIGIGLTAPASSSNIVNNVPVETVKKAELVITTKDVSVKSVVPFTEKTIDGSSLANGTTKVTQEGVNGERTGLLCHL